MHGRTIRRSAIVFLLVFAGCNMNGDEPKETLEQGVERARSYVEDTVDAAATGYDVKPEAERDPIECNDGFGMGDGTFNGGYGVKLRVPDEQSASRLFEETASYWESKGYTISLENAQRGEPVGDDAVVAVELEDGYYGALEVFPSRGNAFLGISTPCLPRANED